MRAAGPTLSGLWETMRRAEAGVATGGGGRADRRTGATVTTTHSATVRLPDDATAPRTLRAFVRELLQSWGLEALVDATMLLGTELVTNAVLHAASATTVTLARHGSGIRLSVEDLSTVAPARRRHSGQSTTGRGLALPDDLADAWGCARTTTGKTVWCELSGSVDPWAAWTGDGWSAAQA